MLRICLYGSSACLGGTEVYLITMVRELSDKIRFDYLIHHDVGKIPFEDEIVALGGKVYREYFMHRERKCAGYISPKNIIRNHPEWDGIYVNVQRIHTAYQLLIEAKKAMVPYRIIHGHNNGYSGSISLKDKLYENFFKLTKKTTITHYLACSKSAGDWMFGKTTSATVIPNAVNFTKFQMNDDVRNQMRSKCGIERNTIVLGFCGRLSYQKKPEFLIEIINELKKNPRYKLLIVGDGNLTEVLQKRAAECGVSDKVIFVGAADNVSDYYQMMDCFVLPSRYEGFGIVLLEAQAAGLRCYTTDKVVPAETNVTGRVTFISQEASAKVWADIIEAGGFDRVNCQEELEKSDYSLKLLKKKLLEVFELNNSYEV